MATVVSAAAIEVARTVRARRVELNWSQEALASRMTKLGVNWHQTTVAKVESTARPRALTVPEVVALTLALGLPDFGALFGADSAVPRTVLSNFSQMSQQRFERELEIARRALKGMTTGPDAMLPPEALEIFDAEIARGSLEIAQRREQIDQEATVFSEGLEQVNRLMTLLRASLPAAQHDHAEDSPR